MNKFYSENLELLPRRSTENSAGYDFIAPCDVSVPAKGVSEVVDTEVSICLDSDKVLMCYIRSSYGFKHNITLVNNVGIIDSDFYPNTIKVKFKNDSDADFIIKKGDKMMQGIINQYFKVDDDECSTKRHGGIGSTGK